MRIDKRGLAMAAAAACALSAPAAAQSLGDRVSCTATAYFCSAASATVGSGVEFTYGPTTNSPFLNVDFATNLLTISSRVGSIQLGSGQSISFRDTTNAFGSATFISNTNTGVTNFPAVSAADVVFTNGLVTINLAQRAFSSTGVLTIGLTTLATAVPEPASWAMMIAGFGAVGFAMRRRKVAVRFA